jgi:hypothetical protein
MSLDQWTYYLNALWYNPELGLSSLIADLMLVALLWSCATVVRDTRLTPLLVFIGVWYGVYSVAGGRSPQFARYMASVLPFGFVLTGAFLHKSITALRPALSDRRVARTLGSIALLVGAMELVRQVGGPYGIGQQFWFIQPNPSAAQIVDFIDAHLGPADDSVLVIGASNEISPDLVRLEWMRAAGRPGQRVLTPDTLPPAGRRGSLYEQLRRQNIGQVLAIRVGEGSRLDTVAFRATLANEGGYERYAPELENTTTFTPGPRLVVAAGQAEVMLWRVAQAP